MAEFTFGQMLEQAGEAAAENGATSDIEVPAGVYIATIVSANSKRSQKGKLTIGAKFRIDTEGPFQEAGVWMNQYLSPESPKAMDIWFRQFQVLGIARDHWAQFGADLDAAGADVATRIKGVQCTIVTEVDGEYGSKVKTVKPLGRGTAEQGTVRTTRAAQQPAAAPGRPTPSF